MNKTYYQKNKERLLANQREYYTKNKERISAKQSQYNHRADIQEKRLKYLKDKYNSNKKLHSERIEERRKKQKIIVDDISLHYGCQNPNCGWGREFHPSQLDFHHLSGSNKVNSVSSLIGCKNSKVATEINKCIVLCRNCHVLLHAKQITIDHPQQCSVDSNLCLTHERNAEAVTLR